MTSESDWKETDKITKSEEESPEHHKDIPLPTTDWLLDDIVSFQNRGGDNGAIHFPITLFVGGTVVCGLMCNGSEYFNSLDANMQEYFEGIFPEEETVGENYVPLKKQAANGFTNKGKQLYQMVSELEKGADKGPTGFIHLKNAQIYNETKPFQVKGGTFWRGKLSSVDGFLFGVM